MKNNLIVLFALLLFLSTSCETGKARGGKLDGNVWQLESFEVDGAANKPIANSVITLRFTGDQINGNGGCNSYFGSFESSGNTLTIGETGATKKFCQELSDQESTYLGLLKGSTAYTASGDQLTIFSEGGILRYTAQ